jgi:tRNA pseudouridine13 synthase
VPNAFGAQRFGIANRNADHALAWLTGRAAAPRDPKKRRFLWSALQSELFNEVLARRVAAGTWRTPLLGDILRKTDTGGLFDCTDVEADARRATLGEVSPTGPMFGAKMRAPSGAPLELESRVFAERLGPGFDLARTKPLGEGTRRPLCMQVGELSIHRVVKRADEDAGEQGSELVVCFVLPKGAYATTVLGAALDLEEAGARGAPEAPPREERPEDGAETDPDD